MHKLKSYVYHTLQFNRRTKTAYLLNGFIILLILVSVPIDVIDSLDDVKPKLMRWVLHLA